MGRGTPVAGGPGFPEDAADPFAVEPELLRSFDQTFIAGRTTGKSGAEPVLICNAVGANMAAWRATLADLLRARPVIWWDLRGFGESGAPASDRLDAGAHAEDALAVAEHFGAGGFWVASWSSGTRVALELAVRHPERVRGLVLVTPGLEYTPARALRRLEPASLLPVAAGVAKQFAALLQVPLRAIVSRPELTGIIRQSGLVGATADTAAIAELLRAAAHQDLKHMLATFEAIAGDTTPLGGAPAAPALVVAGAMDPLAPRSMIDDLVAWMPLARLEVYPKATHYLPLEFPVKLSDDIRKFIEENEAS